MLCISVFVIGTPPLCSTKIMVGVAQLVRVPGCGPGCRGFESLRSPHISLDGVASGN